MVGMFVGVLSVHGGINIPTCRFAANVLSNVSAKRLRTVPNDSSCKLQE